MIRFIITSAFAWFFGTMLIYAAPGTIYTVNPAHEAKSNFTSFQELNVYLQSNGVTQDIEIQVAEGEYVEPLILSRIDNPGNHSILIDGNGATLSTYNYALYLEGVNGVEVKDFHFVSQCEHRGGVVYIANADYNSISHCKLEAKGSATDVTGVLVTASSSHNRIEHCNIKASKGVVLAKNSRFNNVAMNKIEGVETGVQVDNSPQNRLEDNYITASSPSDESKGIILDGYAGDMEILANEVNGFAYGIYQSLTYRSSEFPLSGTMANNVVVTNGASALFLQSHLNELKVAFNTFISNGQEGLVLSNPLAGEMEGLTFNANIVIREDEGSILSITNTDIFTEVNYNNLYNSHGFNVNVEASQWLSLEAWDLHTKADKTLSVDPQFIGKGANKYVLSAQSPCIDAGPNAIALGVANDMHGDLRDNQAEIGADEFNAFTFNKVNEEAQMAKEF